MSKKRIAIDMDGVMADVTTQFLKWELLDTGIIKTLSQVDGLEDGVAFPNYRKWVNTEGFFRTMPVMPDAQTVVKELNEKYEVFIVSAATEFPVSLGEKYYWLEEHFPFIGWQQMCFCGSKTIVQADIMIDDHFKNLNYFDGKTLLFTAPHNTKAELGRHQRVENWAEVAKILL